MLTRILEAARALAPLLPPTPLVHSVLLSKHFGREVWLKLESESPVGSFKARGAFRCLMEKSKEGHRTFVTASSGNHGMGVAFAGHRLGLTTHIFVPKSASQRKIDLVREYTPNLVLTDGDFDRAKEIARDFAREKRHYFVDDGGEITIVEGTGTIGLEILGQMTPDAVIVPVGNGALISGIGSVFKRLSPTTRVIGVQPANAPTMYLSWKEKRPVQLDSAGSIADGLVSRVAVLQAVELMNQVADDVVLVSEEQIVEALRLYIRAESRIIEGASATALAVLSRPELHARSVVAIMTGRNIEASRLKELM